MAVTYNDYIYSCYNSTSSRTPVAFSMSYGDRVNYQDNQAFEKCMKIDISKDRFEIPCAFKYIVCDVLRSNILSTRPVDVVNIPLIVSRLCTEESKTANPVLKKFFRETDAGTLLCRKKAGGTYYVGGEGIIMYDDLTPLMMFTLEVEKVIVSGRVKYAPVRQILRINPEIYNNSDLMAKHIRTSMIGKILPMKMEWPDEMGVPWSYRRRALRNVNDLFTTPKVNWDFKVVIDDFSDFFNVPSIPDCTFRSENVNKMLSSKYDEIVKLMNI